MITNITPEHQLIGALLTYPEQSAEMVFGALKPEMFGSLRAGNIFDTFRERFEAGEHFEFMTLRYNPELVQYAAECMGAIPSFDSNKLARIISDVIEDHHRRLMAGLSEQITKELSAGRSLTRIWDQVDSVREVIQSRRDETMFTLAELVDDYGTREFLEESTVSCLHTGFSDFDKRIIAKPGDLIILAGRPSMGKTDFALLSSKEIAKTGSAVGIISLEMRGAYLMKRLADSEGHKITGDQYDQFLHGCSEVAGLPIVIDESPSHSLSTLRGKVQKMVREYNIQFLVIDYLTLLDPPDAENRTQEVGKLSKGVKHLARALDIPIMLLSQLNRGVESRQDKRPQLADLRDSGNIEQDADIVLFAYRPIYYGEESIEDVPDTTHYMEIIGAKQRDGARGAIRFHYDPAKKILKQWDGGNVSPF